MPQRFGVHRYIDTRCKIIKSSNDGIKIYLKAPSASVLFDFCFFVSFLGIQFECKQVLDKINCISNQVKLISKGRTSLLFPISRISQSKSLDKIIRRDYVSFQRKQISPEERLDISVIIPIRDGNETLVRCLNSLKASSLPPAEVIVVDDFSREDCSEIVKSFGFKWLRVNEPREAEYARNKGAESSSGDILVFTDCDMVIHPDALEKIHHHFCKDHYAAISGVCSPEPQDRSFASRYKHLWMYYSYVKSPRDFDFWISSIGAVKREVFFGVKGFGTTFQTKYGGGDLEFGRRLKLAGHKICLDRSGRASCRERV